MSLQLCLGIPGGCQPVSLSALEKGQRGALLVYNSDSSDGTGTTGSQFGKKVFFRYPSVVDNGGTKVLQPEVFSIPFFYWKWIYLGLEKRLKQQQPISRLGSLSGKHAFKSFHAPLCVRKGIQGCSTSASLSLLRNPVYSDK